MEEELVYIGTKVVKACQKSENDFLIEKGRPTVANSRDGYEVTYEDGYEAWSPRETFERAYRVVTDAEKAMM